jgi:hypothetical protein
VAWSSNLAVRFEEYKKQNPKKRHLHSSGYMCGEALQAYARFYKCLFVLVQPTETRGTVKIKLIFASDNYSSSDQMFVINTAGETWDYYVPIKPHLKEKFESEFRGSVEVSSPAFLFFKSCNYT